MSDLAGVLVREHLWRLQDREVESLIVAGRTWFYRTYGDARLLPDVRPTLCDGAYVQYGVILDLSLFSLLNCAAQIILPSDGLPLAYHLMSDFSAHLRHDLTLNATLRVLWFSDNLGCDCSAFRGHPKPFYIAEQFAHEWGGSEGQHSDDWWDRSSMPHAIAEHGRRLSDGAACFLFPFIRRHGWTYNA